MPLNKSASRPDIGYLRRRPKAGENTAVADSPAVSTNTGGLSLGRPDRAAQSHTSAPAVSTNTGGLSLSLGRRPDRESQSTPSSPATTAPVSMGGGLSLKRPDRETSAPSSGNSSGSVTNLAMGAKARRVIPTVPYFQKNVELTLDEPVVRFDYRQSAIGSMTIDGAQAFAWETTEGMGGLEVNGGTSTDIKPPAYGNRQLVEFVDDTVVLGLRHFRQLRRLVVASQEDNLTVNLYGGSKVVIDSDGGNNVLLISRIDNELECRIEKIDTVDLLDVFGIKVSKVSLT